MDLEKLGLNVREHLRACSRGSAPIPDTALKALGDGDYYEPLHGTGELDSDIVHESNMEFGVDTEEEVEQALGRLVSEARANGLSPFYVSSLQSLLVEFRPQFYVRYGPHPPAKVQPLRIRFKEGTSPSIARCRTYKPAHLRALETMAANQVRLGLAHRTQNPRNPRPLL